MAYFTVRLWSNLKLVQRANNFQFTRCSHSEKKGLVLGVYSSGQDVLLTQSAQQFNQKTNGKLLEDIKVAGPIIPKGKARVFFNLSNDYPIVAVAGLGLSGIGFNEEENIDEGQEAVRMAAGVGCQQLQGFGVTHIAVEDMGNARCAGEGAGLGIWKYQEFRKKAKQTKIPKLELYDGNEEKWKTGLILADAQNLARKLMDTPANHMTPTIFSQVSEDILTRLGIKVKVYDKSWAEEMKMDSFLSVAKGSPEPPKFLEITYNGGDKGQKPAVFVGKGITFDSGGISIKSAASMDEMRADMGGAACVVSAIYGAARLKLPVNVIGLIPLCENMPSGGANKPGDVITAMNGKNIQIDNTDAEGRLILADALCYADRFEKKLTLSIATLTGAIRVALGPVCTGVFTTSTKRWDTLSKAGAETGDRVWRMPLWQYYTTLVTDFTSVDLNNISKLKMNTGGSSTAAAFLKEFAPSGDYIHLDIAGVMGPAVCDGIPYLSKGMTGRPTRTLIRFLQTL